MTKLYKINQYKMYLESMAIKIKFLKSILNYRPNKPWANATDKTLIGQSWSQKPFFAHKVVKFKIYARTAV